MPDIENEIPQGEMLETSILPLKYLFVATFHDGHQIHQTPEDRAVLTDKGSAYTDVITYQETSPLRCFVLLELGENGEFVSSYGVDLLDGHFEVNGIPFKMHEGWVKDLRLIFFRRHTHHFMMSNYTKMREKEHTMVYRIGWQTTQNGQNIQRVMEIS